MRIKVEFENETYEMKDNGGCEKCDFVNDSEKCAEATFYIDCFKKTYFKKVGSKSKVSKK